MEIYPINSNPKFMQSSNRINNGGAGNKPLWQYETVDSRNVVYSSSSKDNDVKDIIGEIILQEKNHYLILEGEFDHINKTGYWFDLDYLGT